MTTFLANFVRLMGAVQAGIGASHLPLQTVAGWVGVSTVTPATSLGVGIVTTAAICWFNLAAGQATGLREAVVRGYLTPVGAVTGLYVTLVSPDSWSAVGHHAVYLVSSVFRETPAWVWLAAVGFGAYRAHVARAGAKANVYR